jgi:gamma-glutamylcyclotransferase (GGCT)/AIG2-like uncharacterized protein YtfP
MNDGMEMDQLKQMLDDGRQQSEQQSEQQQAQQQDQQQQHEVAQGQEQQQAPQQNMAPKPIFVYGTLCAKPLLAWVLTGDANRVDEITPLICPAEAQDLARYALRGKDYPAAVLKEGSVTKGYLLQPATRSQRRKLDDFEGEIYRVETVAVKKLDGQQVQADVYIWDGEEEGFDGEWDFGEFERERLEDFLGLFEGMEMVGDDDGD